MKHLILIVWLIAAFLLTKGSSVRLSDHALSIAATVLLGIMLILASIIVWRRS